MSELHEVCPLDRLPDGKGYPITIDDYEIALFRQGDVVHAIMDNCTHQDFPLSGGKVLGDKVKCRAHGAEFCLKSGKALCAPAYTPVQTFPVQVKDGIVYVEIS